MGIVTAARTLAALLLAALAALRFWPAVTAGAPLTDEAFYLAAFRRASAGLSPYADGSAFYYPPAFAAIGAGAMALLGEGPLLAVLRALNLLGLGLLVWMSVELTDLGVATRAAIAGAVVCLAPGASLGMRTGNLSPLVAAIVVGALLGWARHPLLAGAAIGASVAIKPLAAVALPTLAVHRPARGRPPRLALATAGGITLLAALAPGRRWLGEYLRRGAALDPEGFPLSRTVSLHRLLFNLGLAPGRLLISATVLLVTLWLARRRAWGRRELIALTLAAASLSAPVLWSHSLLMTLPLQALAVSALRRRPPVDVRSRVPGWTSPALVASGILALHFADGVGGVAIGPSPWLALALAPAVLAPPLLAAFVAHSRPDEDPSAAP